MFQNSYQAGPHVEILEIKGSKDKDRNDERLFRVNNPNGLAKVYDKTIKSYLYEVDGTTKTKMQFPRDERQELGLTQRFLVFQIFLPFDSVFSLETVITDTAKSKRRLIFTTSVKEIEKTHFHIKIPLETIKKGVWLNLSFDLVSFFGLFSGCTFRSLDGFILGGACRLRKIFTMKTPIAEFSSCDEEAALPYLDTQSMNKTLNFSSGVVYNNQLITYTATVPIQKSISSIKDISPRNKDAKSSSRGNTGSFYLSSTHASNSSRMKDKESLSPIQKKPRRNISLYITETKLVKEPENKENSSSALIRRGELTASNLLSPVDSRTMQKFGRKAFHSPIHSQASFDRFGQTGKAHTLEDISSPKSIVEDQKTFTFKLPGESIERKDNNDDKKKVLRLFMKNTAKPSPNKAQRLIELGDKISQLSKESRVKLATGSYFIGSLSPKIGTVPNLTANSVKAKDSKNPWSFSEVSLLSAKNSKRDPERVLASPLKTIECADRREIIQIKRVEEKPSVSLVRKDIHVKTTQATLKDFSCESERFSTFYRSREENAWPSAKENDSLRPPGGIIDDDIESIEENLEYEVNSNTSGVCGSRNMIEVMQKKSSVKERDSIRENKRNIGTPELYRMFTMRNEDITESTNLLSSVEKGSLYRNSRIDDDADEGKVKRRLNQLEEKVKNIVTNSRPFSPPFASNVMRRTVSPQVPDQAGLSEMVLTEGMDLSKVGISRSKVLKMKKEEEEEGDSQLWKQFYGVKKV